MLRTRRSVRWGECAHGHQFGIVAETVREGRSFQCPVCGTVTLKVGERAHEQIIPLPLPKDDLDV